MMIIDKKVATLPEWNEAEAIKTTNRLELFRIKDGFNQNNVFCKHCGCEIDADSKFCKKCGKEQ